MSVITNGKENSMSKLILVEKMERVCLLTLNAPDKLNALSEEMIENLSENLKSVGTDSSINAIILQGAGKAFCAGHDLKEMTLHRQKEDGGKEYFNWLFKKCAMMMMEISRIPKPVIAQVHGVAAAAGCQLVASCDLAIASQNATFGVNGVNIGLFCSTPMVALSRNISRKKTFEMLVTGDFMNADEAEKAGLVNKVTDLQDLSSETLEMATKISNKLSSAIKIGKEAFYKQIELPVQGAYEYTAQVIAENMLHRDTEEGIAAFLEKRTPEWDS